MAYIAVFKRYMTEFTAFTPIISKLSESGMKYSYINQWLTKSSCTVCVCVFYHEMIKYSTISITYWVVGDRDWMTAALGIVSRRVVLKSLSLLVYKSRHLLAEN